MKRGKILAAMLAIAGVGMLALGATSTPASADPYCGPGYHYYGGYCYPNPPPVTYYPPAYYVPPPVVVGPTFGIGIGFGGGWHNDHDHDWHGGGYHGHH
jgi:hypothetical protein